MGFYEDERIRSKNRVAETPSDKKTGDITLVLRDVSLSHFVHALASKGIKAELQADNTIVVTQNERT